MALLLAWMSSDALANDFYLESAPQGTRAEAVAHSREAADAGYKGRVVRRYRQGTGWQYLVRITGFPSEDQAYEVAEVLAARLGHPVAVLDEGGAVAREVLPPRGREVVPPSGERQSEKADRRVEKPVDLTDAYAILARAATAHGGRAGSSEAILSSPAVIFRFKRTLPDGFQAEHTWATKGDARFLEVRVTHGEGRSSQTSITGEGAWLAVDQGDFETTDRDRALETVARFEPQEVIPFVLVLAEALGSRPELEQLEVQGTETQENRELVVLTYEGDQNAGPFVVKVEKGSWRIAEVSFDGGNLITRFEGWSRQGEIVVPTRVRTWQKGRLADVVEVTELTLDARPPKEWFAPR